MERTGACLYPSDFADFKLRAGRAARRVLPRSRGSGHRECPVRLAVGAWSKSVVVVGRRVWTESILGSPISEPLPFVTMPLGYETSSVARSMQNPVGKGLDTPELPNVEYAGSRMHHKSDRPEPASFGPSTRPGPRAAASSVATTVPRGSGTGRHSFRMTSIGRTSMRHPPTSSSRATSVETRKSRS